ncbi:hypothetical protein [Methanocella sp. MCL-LM]|uniref:hypothetical protein n=1 Tax=Methanocella sp. MCL-LM TaxID=3412035 RepID=UPI003C77F77D
MRNRLCVQEDLETREELQLKGIRVNAQKGRDEWIVKAINPFIGDDTTTEYLEKVLVEEFSVCRDHVPKLMDTIIDVYGLYSPDGTRLKAV